MKPKGSYAVMSQRRDELDALDDYPTPPFAVRALTRIVLPELGIEVAGRPVLEPACGRGIMAAVLRDEGASVCASDVHRYEDGAAPDLIGSYVGEGPDVIASAGEELVITNPPFVLALPFTLRALADAKVGVAMLCRSNWAEGGARYRQLFKPHPPTLVAQFCERVPMTSGAYWIDKATKTRHRAYRGGFDPQATTATAYSWFVWLTGGSIGRARARSGDHPPTRLFLIPPGQRKALTMPDDAARFGKIRFPPTGEPSHLSTIKGAGTPADAPGDRP